jgi:hypothetical protein
MKLRFRITYRGMKLRFKSTRRPDFRIDFRNCALALVWME